MSKFTQHNHYFELNMSNFLIIIYYRVVYSKLQSTYFNKGSWFSGSLCKQKTHALSTPPPAWHQLFPSEICPWQKLWYITNIQCRSRSLQAVLICSLAICFAPLLPDYRLFKWKVSYYKHHILSIVIWFFVKLFRKNVNSIIHPPPPHIRAQYCSLLSEMVKQHTFIIIFLFSKLSVEKWLDMYFLWPS